MYHSAIILILHFIVGCTSNKRPEVPSLMEERQDQSEVFWLPYRALSMEEYKSQPQIIYVTADWCLTCVLFERNILLHSSIQESLLEEDFAAFRADWTQHDPDVSSLMERYNVRILPFLVINKEGKTVLLKDSIQREELIKAITD